MSDDPIEEQLRLVNHDLTLRITQLEETLREKSRLGDALQESEKRYRRLFESAKDGILILDAETGKVVDVNPFLLQTLGYPYDALHGQFIWELGVFKDIAASQDAFKTLQCNEYIRYDDLPLETSEGKSIAVEFVSNVYLVDHCKVIQCNIRDITARKRADAERKRLMAAIEQAGEAVVITDSHGEIQFVNPAFERMSGYGHEEALGKNVRFLKSGKQEESFYRCLWETISGGQTWAGRMVNRRKDGACYTEVATISPVRDPAGRIVNYVAVMRDITEVLRLEARYQQAQKMEAIGQLAGGVAHDFNNMLSVIIGNAEMAQKKLEPDHPVQGNLAQITTAAMRSADITRQLLAFARKQTITPIVLDLNQEVEHMLKMLRPLLGERIELVWKPGSGMFPVRMDPIQIHQILTNLCINSRDAIGHEGKVTMETQSAAFDEAYCAAHPGFGPGEFVLLTVADNGCGMKTEILDQIFDPFFTTKPTGQGTGLGLSTVLGIVKQNQGFIDVLSTPEGGTTFRIFLPRCADQAILGKEKAPEVVPMASGETVLLVEDEESILEMVKVMLEELGYQVLATAHPEDALVLAAERPGIHLLITDVVMPGMSGPDLAERLQGRFPHLQTLFMSGYSPSVIAHRDLVDDAVNFIQKPFTMMDLAARVRRVLEGGERKGREPGLGSYISPVG